MMPLARRRRTHDRRERRARAPAGQRQQTRPRFGAQPAVK